MTNRTIQLWTTTAIALLMCTATHAQTVGNGSAPKTETSVSEVIVTASKREQKLKDVPAAETALTAQTLQNLGISTVRDLASIVPGFQDREGGVPGYGTIIVRGLTTGFEQTTATTAVYFDDAQVTSSAFLSGGGFIKPDADVSEVSRIEVLKGPQGTLYGASSLGGLLQIVSADPNSTNFFGSIHTDFSQIDGGGGGYSVKGTVNIPLIQDKLAVRISGLDRETPGYIDDVGTGGKNVNSSDTSGGRIAIEATPTSQLTLKASAIIQNTTGFGQSYQDNHTNTFTPVYGRDKYSSFFDPTTQLKYRIYSGSGAYDFGPVSWITSVSYVSTHLNTILDWSDAYGPIVAHSAPPDTGVPVDILSDVRKWTADSRLVSKRLGPVEFVAGAYYTHESDDYNTHFHLANEATDALLPAPFDNFLTTLAHSTYEEYAGYADVTWYLTDSVDVTGGIRYSHNDQTIASVQSGLLLGGGPAITANYTFNGSAPTYLATLRWRVTDQISTYLRAASGYRPGGPQVNPFIPPGAQTSIRPDTDWDYEAGVKGTFFDHLLDLNASAYHIDWSNIQLQGAYNGILLQENGGQAKVDGFELDAHLHPARQTVFGLYAGYTDAQLTSINPSAASATGAAAGDTLPSTPRWTAALTADQLFTVTNDITGSLGATLHYTSTIHSSFPGDATNPDLILPAITTVDLRAGLTYKRYTIEARIDNLFDARGFISAQTLEAFAGEPVRSWGLPNRPRMFTLDFGAKF